MRRALKWMAAAPLAMALAGAAHGQSSRYENLAGTPFQGGYPTRQGITALQDELYFQRAVQSYIWALPALNMYGMKEGSEKTFGKGYNVLPIWKDRLNAKTRVTTPNSDVIYAMGYLDLKEDGPMVIEVPPGLQGILDDFFQRPICTEGEIEGRRWCGDVGLPGPDKGKGGKYLLLPPDYRGEVPPGYITMRSRTYGVFVFWRGFFKDPKALAEPVRVMEQTRIYPLGKEASARPMQFPNASGVPVDMLYPTDGSAFDMLARYIAHEYADPQDMEMRGMLAALGIRKDKPFAPDARQRALLDKAARTAAKMAHVASYEPQTIVENGLWYPDRRWLNVFPGNATFTAETFNYIDPRTGFFANAYSASPGMAVEMVNVGAKYPATFVDADGKFLSGGNRYKLTLPKDVPAALFWSVTIYDSLKATGVDNGQPFPSINTMDKPAQNADGSTDIYFGPTSPGEGRNWLRTLPGQGYFVILRLYGPTQAFFDKAWKPSDLVRQK
ncbi:MULTISPECIES: DUF1254 domain-containing protein [Cupriavidus]|uniref:DUF1254 domain-containing protein n=2 Tax=Pseudomonadota TaxID=1224 RepID=A0A3G8H610_9BURK|nr:MULTISPECIES: DUF1254 domain-containing protein [Cupriavidus]AZG15961.1 DUF1254 domain-containing protein [Cupriavidus pauculus]MDT6964135.1 DUF1254 domain-containing protein [Cupriavidus sp. SZY C1]